MSSTLPEGLEQWLIANAAALDAGTSDADRVVPELAAHGLFRIGVEEELGGAGGSARDALCALALVAEHSLTAAFVLWGQRTFIEYLRLTPNTVLRDRWLKLLLDGRLAGATGLSNAIKFLSGIEELQVTVTPGPRLLVQGQAPWVTNLRRTGFVVAVAALGPEAGRSVILALPNRTPGLVRTEDFRLFGLGGSNTAALRFEEVRVSDEFILHPDARRFVADVRPVFLGLQCGLAIGLARASLRVARRLGRARDAVLTERVEATAQRLNDAVAALEAGLDDGRFVEQGAPLFALRIQLARAAQDAVELELGARGGSAYLSDRDDGFTRRWREAAFLPIVSPSLVQLEHELRCRTAVAAE